MRRAALRNYLLSLSDLVGIVAADAVFPIFLPQRRVWPAVLIGRTGFAHEECMEEPSGLCMSKGQTSFDIHCRSLDPDEADRMAEIINGYKDHEALDGFRGTMSCSGRAYKVYARVTDWRDEAVPPVHDDPLWLASVALTTTITFEEQ